MPLGGERLPRSTSIDSWSGSLAHCAGSGTMRQQGVAWPFCAHHGMTTSSRLSLLGLRTSITEHSNSQPLAGPMPSAGVGLAVRSQVVMALRSEMPRVRQAGLGVVHTYEWESSQDDVAARRYLDAAWSNGLRVFIGFDRGNGSGRGLVQGNLDMVVRRVAALCDHPGLF